MTERKITFALKRIEACKKGGFFLEGLMKAYHLNLDLVKYILSSASETYSAKDKKLKQISKHFVHELSVNPNMKSLIQKNSFKAVKLWLEKMDVFLKTLRHKQPANVKALLLETEKIFGILNISVNKLFVRNKP
jgi:hypothetical protein